MTDTNITVTQTQTIVSPAIKYDPSYCRTIPGIVKIVCIVLGLVGFISIECSPLNYHSRGNFFNSVAMGGFWFTGIMLIFYIFHVCEKFHRIPWLRIEMFFCALWAILYIIASSLAATFNDSAYTAAAFFGFCAMIAYGFDSYLKFVRNNAGDIAQGSRVIIQQQHTQTITH